MSDSVAPTKIHTFIMKGTNDIEIRELQFVLATRISVKDAVDEFTKFLVEHMEEPLDTLRSRASDIINSWGETGKFPDGAFFFMKAKNDFGWRMSYMYKKETVIC